MAADVTSGEKVAEMTDIEKLETGKQMEWQTVQEMQTQLAEKRSLVQTVLEEIKQGMPLVKELQARASKNDEDAILQIKTLQGRMKERKETLEKAVEEMEKLSVNMRIVQSQALNRE